MNSAGVWVGRCGWDAQTLTLFKTEIFDFPTLLKTSVSDEFNSTEVYINNKKWLKN